jgi:phage recombination protein Bet
MAVQKKTTAVATAPPITQPSGLIAQFASKYSIDKDKMLDTLKQTAFKQRKPKGGGEPQVVSNEQMMALLVVAKEYGLNPFTREIYAFPSEGGIVPIIGFDGWMRMINEHPQMDYMEVREAPVDTEQDDYFVEVEIKRKDRSRPTVIREYLKECYRNTDPWNEMPRRMTRHKGIIQCGRVAFGFAGIFDPDDADKIVSIVEQPTRTKIETPRAKAEPEVDIARITQDQATVITDKLNQEGVEASLFLAAFSIGSVEDLPANRYAQAFEAIDKLSAA